MELGRYLLKVNVTKCDEVKYFVKKFVNIVHSGLAGDVKLVEIGGPPYLVPLVKRDKIYDLNLLLQHLKRDPGFLAGAGAGPWPYLGVNCEVCSRVDLIDT